MRATPNATPLDDVIERMEAKNGPADEDAIGAIMARRSASFGAACVTVRGQSRL